VKAGGVIALGLYILTVTALAFVLITTFPPIRSAALLMSVILILLPAAIAEYIHWFGRSQEKARNEARKMLEDEKKTGGGLV
jgi:hypothetical protein